MLFFAENADELEKEKMKFCAHKDEMIVGVGRPWKKARTRQLPPSAYPLIVSNLGNINSKEDEKYKIPRMMITFLFHTAQDVVHRAFIIEGMEKDNLIEKIGPDCPANDFFFTDNAGNPQGLGKFLDRLHDYYPVGVGNTIAYANPRSGDTVGSVMIGGLRTVMNGDWEVHAGDLVQWYWTFEKDCFRKNGTRKSYMLVNETTGRTIDKFGMDPYQDLAEQIDSATGRSHPAPEPSEKNKKDTSTPQERAANIRGRFNDLQYGIKPQSYSPSDKAKSVARIKTYMPDTKCPRMYDKVRVFGRAIGTARPREMLDIQICRQSM